MKRLAIVSLVVGGLAIIGVGWHARHSAYDATSKSVMIRMAADGQACVVRDVNVKCSEVATYLRVELKLDAGTQVWLRPDRAVPYSSVKAVYDDLARAGYLHSTTEVTEYREAQ